METSGWYIGGIIVLALVGIVAAMWVFYVAQYAIRLWIGFRMEGEPASLPRLFFAVLFSSFTKDGITIYSDQISHRRR